MIIASCFVALSSAAVSVLALWPSIGPMSLLAVPFLSSAAVLVAAAIVEGRAALRCRKGQDTAKDQVAAF